MSDTEQKPTGVKRVAADAEAASETPLCTNGSLAGTSKRARTASKNHTEDCHDASCKGCAGGEIALDPEVLALPAEKILALAEQEEAEGGDRSVVTKLYEASVEKFAGQSTLASAWALLRCAEFVDYDEYAADAVAVVSKAKDTDKGHGAKALLINGRAQVLRVCLRQENRRSQQEAEDETEAEDLSAKVSGRHALEQGLADISASLKAESSEEDNTGIVENTLAFFAARCQRYSLIHSLRLALLDCALDIALRHVDWSAKEGTGSHVLACKIAIWWTMAMADSTLENETQSRAVEERLGPIVAYLETQASDLPSCKLHAQLLIVLSSALADEDKVVEAFDAAIRVLQAAHKIAPEDRDIIDQLEDLGAEA
ncbi:hypothetical protein LPJ75_001828 [Coemansia sp. RSA 2598]|nr:hypothetical protein LPJ75_001828 [Coemansia sp. RSA 2598]